MKQTKIVIVLFAVIIFAVIAGVTVYYFLVSKKDDVKIGRETYPIDMSARYEKKVTHLYFSDPDEQCLKAEERTLPIYDTTLENARAATEALIAGPKGRLCRTIPEGVILLSIYLMPDRTAYVDFDETIAEKHPGGAGSELLTIYSIVNTLALNFPDIDRVKILIRGREQKTLAGHVSIQDPFGANLLLIR